MTSRSDRPIKLAAAQVAKIRDLAAAGEISQADLARRFGVSRVTVSEIVRGKKRRNAGAVR